MRKILSLLCFLAAAVMVQAQDCQSQLDEANRLYKKKDYQSTLSICQGLVGRSVCKESVGEDATRLIKLCEKRIEEEDFNKCTSVEGCDLYLQKHPKGKHVAHVTELRAALASAAMPQPKEEPKEVVVVQETVHETVAVNQPKEDFIVIEEPIIEQPKPQQPKPQPEQPVVVEQPKPQQPQPEQPVVVEQPKPQQPQPEQPVVVEQPKPQQPQPEQPVVVEQPKPEQPKPEPKPEIKENVEVEVKEGVKEVEVKVVTDEPVKPVKDEPAKPVNTTPKYHELRIQSVDFANADRNRNIINDYGFEMYTSDIKYLIPRITYEGLSQDLMSVSLDCKIVNPNGSIQKSTNSPEGYTYSLSLLVRPGAGNTSQLPAWGNDSGGVFVPGDYRLEVWHDGDMLYQKPFTVLERTNPLSRGNWRRALKECSVNVTSSCGTGSYKGQKERSNRNGLGLFAWDDGSFYIGNWLDGDQSGMAIYAVPKGRMVMNCPQSAYYVGEWTDKVKTGKGKCYDKDGNALYNGTFVNDAPAQSFPMTGLDSYKFECIEYDDGHCYVGETVNGKQHGMGMLIWENGNVWYGRFIYGERDGDGVELLYDGTVTGGTWEGDTKL